MLNRTWRRVGHGRKREVGDGRRGIQGEEKWEKINLLEQHRPSFLLNLAWLLMSGNV